MSCYFDLCGGASEEDKKLSDSTNATDDDSIVEEESKDDLEGRFQRTSLEETLHVVEAGGNDLSVKQVVHPAMEVGEISMATTPQEELDDIDLEFVEEYDKAFDEFMEQNPKFLVANPDVVNGLRVAKLEALLDNGDRMERELTDRINCIQEDQSAIESDYREKLLNASRRKAACKFDLQKRLTDIQRESRSTEGRLIWKFFVNMESQAKREHGLRLGEKPNATTRQELLELLPDGPDFSTLRETIHTFSDASAVEDQGLQSKIDIQSLRSEIVLLNEKLDCEKESARKEVWVESVLVRMDENIMETLKSRFQDKVGASLD